MATKLPPLEAGLLAAMRAIDNQIAREMQRSPSEVEKHGVTKWEPYRKRMEHIVSFILDSLGDNLVELDSLVVIAEAASKALLMYVEDLESSGLGKVRSSYCLEAMEKIQGDCERAIQILRGKVELT